MRRTEKVTFTVRNFGRSISDDYWEDIEPSYITAWHTATSLLRVREISINDIDYRVKVDWSPLLLRTERHLSAMRYLNRGGNDDLATRILKTRFPRRAAKLDLHIESTSKKGPDPKSVAEVVLHDIFLMMNIAAPGSCDFHRSDLTTETWQAKLALSNYLFETTLYLGEKGFPSTKFIPLDKVIEWYDRVRGSGSMIPQNPTERALFALLHLAKLDGDAVGVVWIFYALEGLLETRIGENFSSMIRRLGLLLDSDPRSATVLRRGLRSLYDIRSALVHGGYEVIHPMGDAGLDKRAEKSYDGLVIAMDIGYGALIAAIQTLVMRGLTKLCFKEFLLEPDALFPAPPIVGH